MLDIRAYGWESNTHPTAYLHLFFVVYLFQINLIKTVILESHQNVVLRNKILDITYAYSNDFVAACNSYC